MNTYEALMVFKPALDMDTPDSAIKSVENTLNQLKGKVVKMDKVGRKRLAYEIGKFKDGFITTIWFQLPGDAVSEFKKICQINEDILRLTMLRLDNPEFAVPGTTSTVSNQPGVPGGRDHRDRDHHHRGGDRDFRGPRHHEHRGEGRPDHREPRPQGFQPQGQGPQPQAPAASN